MKPDVQAVEAVEHAAEHALTELADLRVRLAEREARVARLRATCAERQKVIDTLREACDERLALIEQLSKEVDALRAAQPPATSTAPSPPPTAHGIDWHAVALEREAAFERLSAEAERRSVLLAELTAALHDRTEEADQLRRSRTRTS